MSTEPSVTRTAPADATGLGHDMAYRPHNQPYPDADRWECRRCGRIAYQYGDSTCGTATAVSCISDADVTVKER